MKKLPRPGLNEFRDAPDEARIRLPVLLAVTGMSKSTIWRRVASDPQFPRPLKDGACTYWRVGEVRRYLAG